MFYKRHNLMFRLGIFYCAAPLSGAFGGLLATGLSQISYHGYNGWVSISFGGYWRYMQADDLSQPWIFFIEGAVTIIVAGVAFFFLPNTPGSARFLTEDEQWVAAHRLWVDMHGATSEDNVEEEKFSWTAVS